MRTLPTLAAILALGAPALAGDGGHIAHNFCYAIVAMGNCGAYTVSATLEPELEVLVGAPLRGPDSPHAAACGAGMDLFFDTYDSAGEAEACTTAWDRVGPLGTEAFGYLIESQRN